MWEPPEFTKRRHVMEANAMSGIPMVVRGKCSCFGPSLDGKPDSGMTDKEGLALYEHKEANDRPDLFLSGNESLGVCRRLRPDAHFIAMRFPKGNIRRELQCSVWRVEANGKSVLASLVDWGPAEWTGRALDLSSAIMAELGIKTDDVVSATRV
jgi:hypothetical protein